VDHDTQQLDGNNPQSEGTHDVSPDVNPNTDQDTPPEASAATESAPAAPPEPVSSMSSDERKAALEAIIYAADEPATIEQLAKALGEPKNEVQVALDELIASYAAESRGIEIRGVAGGYKMYTKPQHHDLVRRFIKSLRPPLRLTMPALETLAVISYKQPVTAPEIQEIRGVNTSGVIKTLLDKKLITTAGRKEVIGRPILYRTSKEFLMRFGLSDLGELPSLKEFEALAREALGTDEGVAEGETGDESVLDSVEPTDAEAAAELEASASEDSNEATTEPLEEPAVMAKEAAAGAEEPSTPRQFEQSISPDVAEAIAAHTAHASAAAPETEAATSEDVVEAPQSETAEPVFAEAETTQAVGLSMETPESQPCDAETEGTEREISDEILAQLTQGIEIEVSADSLAALSSSNVPAEGTPAEFYSSDAEPEREPLPNAQASENPAEQSSDQATSESDPQNEREKSRGAAAGE
jgi:segregation and condensation protein B